MAGDPKLAGEIGLMGELADHLADLASVPSRAAKGIAEDLTALIEEGYAAGVDPYGVPWAPLAKRTLRRHGPPPLTYRGDMRAETYARPRSGAGVALEAPFPAGIHMTGGDAGEWHMPERPMFPTGPMPEAWEDVIDDRIEQAIAKGRKR